MNLKLEKLELEMADISGSRFEKVKAEDLNFNDVCLVRTQIHNANMSGMALNDVNMSGFKISDANLSNLEISEAQMGGAYIRNIGIPKEGDPHYNPKTAGQPIRFENCELRGSQISNCDLSNVEILDCELKGMKINGILVEELLNNYKNKQSF
ncbi:pentapeptide repeat-containing protein [Paenibacillus allorhizosphaerae]|uniref:Pentapeptide repeat-containing protein n=1 Tax=Paenibacillus allorhizosphaerae TaxID=2849866 RepID=A0ABM8VIX9_9BACL|nr:pentapeptide repeat-containing protein [Paenibacillus allorhizosphaerae]CAG7644770.1 hypothetical protein PAECIP111802_03340 [Paenibacillus allorhizosphaerae]